MINVKQKDGIDQEIRDQFENCGPDSWHALSNVKKEIAIKGFRVSTLEEIARYRFFEGEVFYA